jgi:hypothetical protein
MTDFTSVTLARVCLSHARIDLRLAAYARSRGRDVAALVHVGHARARIAVARRISRGQS